MTRLRPYFLGFLGLAAITFPFLWLQLVPDFSNDTVKVAFAFDHGLQFFGDLIPVALIALLIWLVIWLNQYLKLGDRLKANSAWQTAQHYQAAFWPWVVMPLVLSGAFFMSSSSIGMMISVGIYMVLAVGLNITVGMTGLLVLGYAGFYSFGAYFFALSQQNLTFFPWWLALPCAFVLGGVVGYLLGLPCLRLRGDYLAIVTLGFAEAFRELMRNLDWAGGDKGIILQNAAIFHRLASLSGAQWCYIVTALTLFAVVFLVQRLHDSPIGRAWVAIREDEVAASAVGVPVVQMKLLAFSLSAAIGAVGGVLYAAKDGFVDPSTCLFQQSIMVLAMVILGGLGNTYGVLLGAALLYLVPEYLKFLPTMVEGNPSLSAIVPEFVLNAMRHLSDYRLLLFGGIMVFMMLYRPQGLLGSARRKEELKHA